MNELLDLDGLGEEAVHTAVHCRLTIYIKGVGGHGQNRYPRQSRVLQRTDTPGRLITVHERHLNIHQNKVVITRLRSGYFLYSLHAVFRRVNLEAILPQDFQSDLAVQLLILHQQQTLLLETEGIEVEFTEDAIDQIATMSFLMNEQTENIGARRLHTVLEKLLEDISFNIPEMDTEKVVIDEEYVKEKFQETIHAEDLDRYIL